MSIRIRQGVFETNSSSTHALMLSPERARDFSSLRAALEAGVIEVAIDRWYGWGWERLHRPDSKLAYLLVQAAEEALDGLQGLSPEEAAAALRAASPAADAMIGAVEGTTGCRVGIRVGEDFGVDHESQGVGRDLFDDEAALLDFLFDPRAFVQLGNDNDKAPEFVPTDLEHAPRAPMYEHLQAPARQDGVAIEIEMREFGRELRLRLGDAPEETVVAVAGWCGVSEIAGDLREIVVEAARVTLPRPRVSTVLRIENGVLVDDAADWKDADILRSKGRDALLQLLDGFDAEDGVRLVPDAEVRVAVEPESPEGRGLERPRIRLSGRISEAGAATIAARFRDLAAAAEAAAAPAP